jgi:biopolymer transport protein TolQ
MNTPFIQVPRLVVAAFVSSLISGLASVANAAPASAKVGVKAGVLDGIAHAGFMVQFLLLFMIALSIISWAVMYMKYKQFEILTDANAKFADKFWKATSLENVFDKVNDDPNSSIARVFKAAFLELQRLADSALATSGGSPNAPAKLLGIDNLERAVRKATDSELALAESKLGFLATVGSTSPFIGLLGTVVGIMTSFSNIAASGSASLAVVAPGISEALFSTAVGLFAALPAVAAYNYFVGQLRKIEMDLNSFGSDFLNIAKRNFFKE